MRKLFLILTLTAFTLSVAAQGIKFEENHDLSAALAKAKAENKLVFIDAYAEWCGPCKVMARDIFPQKEVGDFFNTHFVNLKLDMEKGPNVEISKKYEVRAYPTYLFLDANGEQVHRSLGSMKADKFIEIAKIATDSENNLLAISKKIKKGDRSLETIKKFIELNPNDKGNANMIEEYFQSLSEDQIYTKDNWDLFQYIQDFTSPSYRFFLQNKDKITELVGKEAVDNKIAYTIGYNMHYFPEKADQLRAIDPVAFEKNLTRNHLSKMYSKQQKKPNDKAIWDEFTKAAQAYLQNSNNANELNSFAWSVYENHKKFDNKEALTNALGWAKKASALEPNNHFVADTYAHLLFANGKKKDAIKTETKALEMAKAAKDTEAVENYTKAIEIFKKKKK